VFGSGKAVRTDPAHGAAAAVPGRPKPKTFVEAYRAFCYRTLGERFDKAGTSEALAERLKQAGLNVTPGLHRSVVLITTILAVAIAFAVSMVLFLVLLHSPLWYGYVGMITAVSFGSTTLTFRYLVATRISNRREQLERELPFTLSEMSVMASTGMSPIQLVRRMARRDHDPTMTTEFKKVVYKIDVQGKDLITSLAETAKESASNSLREAFWDLANMIHQGGNLDEYFRTKADDVLKLKRIGQKEFIERLQTYLEMYVSLVLIGVLMIAVGAFLLNSFQSTAAGLDANSLLLLLTFGLVPLSVAMTSILIAMAYARAE
jgi:archaeal flagellar protein FlaJ